MSTEASKSLRSFDLTLDADVVGTIDSKHFGHILINKFGAGEAISQADDIGLSFIRFPGGTLAEQGVVRNGRLVIDEGEVTLDMLVTNRDLVGFDLTHPELIAPAVLATTTNRPEDSTLSFSEVIQLAVERDQELSLIIPVQRYFIDQDFTDPAVKEAAIAAVVKDVSIFAERLKSGAYNDGILPKKLLLDIGNEPYWNPIEYAIVAKAAIATLTEKLSGSGIDFDIGFQMGRGSNTWRRLEEEGYIDSFFGLEGALIPELQGFDFIEPDAMKYSDRILQVDRLMAHILGDVVSDIDYVRHHHLSVDVGDLHKENSLFHQRKTIVEFWGDAIGTVDKGRDVDYYVSAWTTDSSNADNNPFSMAAAANILELFRNFAETGVDRAALWGLVGVYAGSDETSPTVISDKVSATFSPQQALLQLMAENLTDAKLRGSGFDVRLRSDDSELLTHTYETKDNYVIFFTAGELEGGTATHDVHFTGMKEVGTITVTNLDIVDAANSGPARLQQQVISPDDDGFSITFDQDYEIAMAIIPKNNLLRDTTIPGDIGPLPKHVLADLGAQIKQGDAAKNSITGSEGSDVIFGHDGDDTLNGGGGRTDFTNLLSFDQANANDSNQDFLFGGAGHDRLYGNDGDDWLDGGPGNDAFYGGGGADTFVIRGGTALITDFDPAIDRILVDRQLLADPDGALPDVLDLASSRGDSVLIDFGESNTLSLWQDDPDLALIADAIEFF